MSGIVGSSHNIRGSGIVAKLGTDGQVFTSAGAGVKQTYEAAGGGAWNLISTFTSDGSDATASITSGIDSTYDVYCFMYTNIHPETDSSNLQFNGSIDAGSNYNVTKVTTFFIKSFSLIIFFNLLCISSLETIIKEGWQSSIKYL